MKKNLGVLTCFHFYKTTTLKEVLHDPMPGLPILIDSGGFSAYSQGAVIDLDEYGRWSRRNRTPDTNCISLDVIGSAGKSSINISRLKPYGDYLPCVHVGSSPDWIDRYHDRGFRYMCLGGMVPFLKGGQTKSKEATGRLMRFIHACHDRADALGVDLHGLGCTTWDIVRKFPWRSVDSSFQNMGVRFGYPVRVYDHATRKWHYIGLRDPKSVLPAVGIIREYGYNPFPLLHDSPHTNETVLGLSVASVARWQNDQRRAPCVYFADGNKDHVRAIARLIYTEKPATMDWRYDDWYGNNDQQPSGTV